MLLQQFTIGFEGLKRVKPNPSNLEPSFDKLEKQNSRAGLQFALVERELMEKRGE